MDFLRAAGITCPRTNEHYIDVVHIKLQQHGWKNRRVTHTVHALFKQSAKMNRVFSFSSLVNRQPRICP